MLKKICEKKTSFSRPTYARANTGISSKQNRNCTLIYPKKYFKNGWCRITTEFCGIQNCVPTLKKKTYRKKNKDSLVTFESSKKKSWVSKCVTLVVYIKMRKSKHRDLKTWGFFLGSYDPCFFFSLFIIMCAIKLATLITHGIF